MNYEEAYSCLHQNEKYFPGYSIDPYVPAIKHLVETVKPARILDYGSGKGFQYLVHRVHEQWGGMLPYCYDVGVRQLRPRPEGTFGGVICTDMMEHIEEGDVDDVLSDIYSFVEDEGFVFFSICCLPARKKKLPDGRNVHLTVKPPAWWNDKLRKYAHRLTLLSVAYEEERP